MRLVVIKVILFLAIVTIALFDYRMMTVKDGRLLIANWHQLSTWTEIEESVMHIEQAEVYPARISRRHQSNEVTYLVIYMDNNFYNIKASDLEMARITNLMTREQIDIVEVRPVETWFYGLLVVLLIVFPVMRKETY